MKILIALLGLSLCIFSNTAVAKVSEDEITLLRQQVKTLSRRLDELERQNQNMAQPVTQSNTPSMATASWADRIRWKGDFRYRYENIANEGEDGRNRSRIRARTHLEAILAPTLQVGIGLATGGDDPVSSNQTIGGSGSSKDIKLDLAYFDWHGLDDTHIIGGKVKNPLIRPASKGLMWDSDWRPEGLGAIWDNDTFFILGLGTWLQGDSDLGTEFAWAVQAGMKFEVGETGNLMFGAGYSVFDIAGRTPLFGLPQDFYGNSFVPGPVENQFVFAYNYHNIEIFAEYDFVVGTKPVTLFADYTINQDVDNDDTGYLFGARYGSAKKKGAWDITYFYEKLEKDAVVGLLTDSDFGGGGTDAKGHVLSGTYAIHDNWNFRASYFLNKVYLDNPRDTDRLQLNLNFKFQ